MGSARGLWVRLLIIVVAPIVVLECVVAFTFMERHWNQVTRRLSEATARNIAAVVDLYESKAFGDDARLVELAQRRFGLALSIMAPGDLPKGGQPKPFFDLLDRALSDEIAAHLRRPFWLDTVGHSRHVEIRIKLDRANLHFTLPRGLAYASNSHIFLTWMVGSSIALIAAATLLLRGLVRRSLRGGGTGAAGGTGPPGLQRHGAAAR